MSKEEANRTGAQVPSAPSKKALDHLVDSVSEDAPGLAATAILGSGFLATALGLAGVVLAKSIRSSTDKQMEATQRMLVAAVNDIRRSMDDDNRLLALMETEEFADLVTDVLKASVATQSAEKRGLLKNILVTSSTETKAREFEARLFIRLVDELEPLHIQVLSFLNSPALFMRGRGRSLQAENVHDGKGAVYQEVTTVLLLAFQDHPDDHVEVVLEDLIRKKLTESLPNTLVREQTSFTTNLGKRFLAMIRA